MIKVRIVLFSFILICDFFDVNGQSVFNMDLSGHQLEVEGRMFFISEVKDQRDELRTIGSAILMKDGVATWDDVVFTPSCEEYLSKYLVKQLPEQMGQIGISVVVNQFLVRDLIYKTDTTANLDLNVDYYHGTKKIFSDKRSINSISTSGTLEAHQNNTVAALKASLIAFDTFDWPTAIMGLDQSQSQVQAAAEEKFYQDDTENNDVPKESFIIEESDEKYELEAENRNIVTVGYQIGGYTLLGIDYEVRVHDHIGIHAGAGFRGYTAGVKFHLKPDKDSSFINLSYKDSGFGLLSVVAAEYGGRWIFNKRSGFGLLYQVGLASIQNIDVEFENLLFNGDAPPVMLSLGVGLSW